MSWQLYSIVNQFRFVDNSCNIEFRSIFSKNDNVAHRLIGGRQIERDKIGARSSMGLAYFVCKLVRFPSDFPFVSMAYCSEHYPSDDAYISDCFQ